MENQEECVLKKPLPVAPYPHRFAPKQKGPLIEKISELFRQVKVNIPLLDAIKTIPSYAKFFKDLCTVKRKLNVHKKVLLTEQVSSILQANIPPKYKDPGCHTISITIGGTIV